MLDQTSILNTTQWYTRKWTAEEKLLDEKFRERVTSIYFSRDSNIWTEQIKRSNFHQHSCTPEGSDNVMFKAKTTLKGNMYHMRQVCCNSNLRKEWETILYDFQALDVTADMNSMKSYYVYKSPRVGFVGVADRDFLLQ